MPLPRPLTSAADLAVRLADAGPAADAPLRLLDVRFDLARPAAGEAAYLEGHLPGARYAHLERDLSAMPPAAALCGGRHPLPRRKDFAATLGRLGIGPGTEVVVYDASGGMYAARAWWMLRWMGHEAVTVLDGGLPAWVASGGALEAGRAGETEGAEGAALPAYPVAAQPAQGTIDAATLQQQLGSLTLIDARGPERYRGEVEPLDPVAGHIPGALNRPFTANLGPDGRFLPPARLRQDFEALLGPAAPGTVVHQCGSGVSACHNLLAMAVAGLGDGLLYPGSWSEWCADPTRPVARG